MMNIYQVTACAAVVLATNGVFAISTLAFNFLNKFYKVKDISWMFGSLALIIGFSQVILFWRFL